MLVFTHPPKNTCRVARLHGIVASTLLNWIWERKSTGRSEGSRAGLVQSGYRLRSIVLYEMKRWAVIQSGHRHKNISGLTRVPYDLRFS